MRNKLFVWGIAITITICLIIAVLNSRRETNKSVKSLRDSDSTTGPSCYKYDTLAQCQADCKGYRAIDNCAGKQPCSPDESNCFASHTACLSSSTGYRAVDNCAGRQPCSPDESNCFTSHTTCLSSSSTGYRAVDNCAGKQPCSPDESNCFTSPTTCLSSSTGYRCNPDGPGCDVGMGKCTASNIETTCSTVGCPTGCTAYRCSRNCTRDRLCDPNEPGCSSSKSACLNSCTGYNCSTEKAGIDLTNTAECTDGSINMSCWTDGPNHAASCQGFRCSDDCRQGVQCSANEPNCYSHQTTCKSSCPSYKSRVNCQVSSSPCDSDIGCWQTQTSCISNSTGYRQNVPTDTTCQSGRPCSGANGDDGCWQNQADCNTSIQVTYSFTDKKGCSGLKGDPCKPATQNISCFTDQASCKAKAPGYRCAPYDYTVGGKPCGSDVACSLVPSTTCTSVFDKLIQDSNNPDGPSIRYRLKNMATFKILQSSQVPDRSKSWNSSMLCFFSADVDSLPQRNVGMHWMFLNANNVAYIDSHTYDKNQREPIIDSNGNPKLFYILLSDFNTYAACPPERDGIRIDDSYIQGCTDVYDFPTEVFEMQIVDKTAGTCRLLNTRRNKYLAVRGTTDNWDDKVVTLTDQQNDTSLWRLIPVNPDREVTSSVRRDILDCGWPHGVRDSGFPQGVRGWSNVSVDKDGNCTFNASGPRNSFCRFVGDATTGNFSCANYTEYDDSDRATSLNTINKTQIRCKNITNSYDFSSDKIALMDPFLKDNYACLSALPPGAKDMCTGITDSTLAKDVSYPCLQQTWASLGCSKTGKWYPSDNSSTWWHSSPDGSRMVQCDDTHRGFGNSPDNCGAGTFGVVKADMAVVASRDTVVHREACGN